MADIWQAAGNWYANVDGVETMHATKQAAKEHVMATTISEQPLEQEFATRIVGALLPDLRKSYLAMVATQVEWQDAAFQAALAAATETGAPLAGFPASTWQTWGLLLLLLQAWLETPLADLDDKTPKSVLLQRYIAQVPA